MKRVFFKPPAPVNMRSSHNDYGPLNLFPLLSRCYPIPSTNLICRPTTVFPAASLLSSILIQKVESMGEYGYGY